MDALEKKGETIIKRFNPKLQASQVKRINEICEFRNKNICKRHYVSDIEQSTQYGLYYLQEITSLSKLISQNPLLLKKKDNFLKEASPWDLATKAWHEPLERKKNKELIEKAQMQKSIESDEKCPNCKVVGKSYCFDLKQMRSADEPMTQLWKCDNCGYRWNI